MRHVPTVAASDLPVQHHSHTTTASAPNTLVERTKWTGIAAVATLWSTQMVLIGAVGFSLVGERPLSYLALEEDIGFLFGLGLTVSAVLFIAFQGHLRHRYRLGFAFSVAMLVGMAGQFIAGVVPIGGTGPENRVHVTAALTLGAAIPVVMWRFAADQPPGAWRRRSYGLFWLEAAACVAGVALSRNQIAPLAEILPALAFHGWVAAVTFGPFGNGSDALDSLPGDLNSDRFEARGLDQHLGSRPLTRADVYASVAAPGAPTDEELAEYDKPAAP